VYPNLAVELPASQFAECFGVLAEPSALGQLLAGTLAGTSRGLPIEGPTDPRLEFRQLLADQIGTLEPVQPDPDTTADAPPTRPERLASALAVELRQLRGRACQVRRLSSWEELTLAASKAWVPVAAVDEAGTVLVVFDTPAGLATSDDFNAALAVLTRFNATAIVVAATVLSPYVELFDAPSLNHGISVPSGQVSAPAPLLGGLALSDAITKFLDQDSAWPETRWSTRASTSPADVTTILSQQSLAAIEDVARQGRRAHISAKIAGYSSAAPLGDDLAVVLQRALGGEAVTAALLELAEREQR